MSRLYLALLVCLLAIVPAHAQTPFQPTYYVGTGVTYDYYGPSGFAANTEFAAKVSGQVYSYSTVELTRTQASLRTGAGYLFFQQGNWLLIALGDAGLTTGSGPTLGSFSTGGLIGYDIGSKLTKGQSHFYLGVGGRLLNITSQTVQPIFSITLGKGF